METKPSSDIYALSARFRDSDSITFLVMETLRVI